MAHGCPWGALSRGDTLSLFTGCQVETQLDSGCEAIHLQTVSTGQEGTRAFHRVYVVQYTSWQPRHRAGAFSTLCSRADGQAFEAQSRLYRENKYRLIRPGPLADSDHPL